MSEMLARLVTDEYIKSTPVDHRDAHSKAARLKAWEQVQAAHEANRKAAKEIEDYGVVLVSGRRRSGKSTWVSAIAETYYSAGRAVFSNIGLQFAYRIDAIDLYSLAKRVPAQSVVIVDEIHTLLSRYAQGRATDRALIAALAGVGKREVLLIGISQQAAQVSHDFRTELDYAFLVQPRARTDAAYPPWCYIKVTGVSKPFQGRDPLEAAWDIPPAPGTESVKTVFDPHPRAMWEASKLFNSWADVPVGKAAGVGISAEEFRERDEMATEVVFEIDGIDDAEATERQLALERYQQRASTWVSLVVSLLAEHAGRGTPLSSATYNVEAIAGMVNTMYEGYLKDEGLPIFTPEEAAQLSKSTLNANNGRVKIADLKTMYPEVARIYDK